MKEYKKMDFHYVRNSGGLSDKELSKLPEEELEEYLKQDSFIQEKKKYKIKSDFILREIAGEYAIVPVGSDNPFSNAMLMPNDSAVFMWKAFEHPNTVQDVVTKGMQEYEVTEDVIKKSIEQFVKESLEYRILEEVE